MVISERGQSASQGAVWERRGEREMGHLKVGVGQHSEKRVLVRCLSGIVRLFAVGFLLYILCSMFLTVSSVN